MGPRRSFLAAATALALACVALAAGFADPGPVRATNPWIVALSPGSLVEGAATNVTVTVTDGSEMIGCVVVQVPAGFAVLSAGVTSVPAGTSWTTAVTGSAPTRVSFSASSNAGRLNSGGSAVFAIRVVASQGPLPAWTVAAYKGITVDSTQLAGAPAAQPKPFTIRPAGGPTPTPVSTPPPSPSATPTPPAAATARPTALSWSTPKPTARLTAAPPGVTPLPTVSAGASSPDASPDASTDVTQEPGASATRAAVVQAASTGTPGPAAGAEGGTSLDIRGLPAGGAVQLESQAMGGVGMFVWAVPVLFLGLPGLLLVLIVALQAGFGTLFVPVTRRVLGLDRRGRARAEVIR
jgi:hypothetical protein